MLTLRMPALLEATLQDDISTLQRELDQLGVSVQPTPPSRGKH